MVRQLAVAVVATLFTHGCDRVQALFGAAGLFGDAGSARSVSQPPTRPTSPPRPTVAQIGEAANLREVARLWARMAANPAASALRIHRVGDDRFALVAPDSVAADQVGALVVLGRAAVARRPTPTDTGLSPALVAPTKGAVLYDAPSIRSPPRRYLPQSSLLVALYGELPGRVSEPGTGSLTYVVASRNDEGWVRGRFLQPYGACVPDLDRLGADAPEGRGDALARDAVLSPRTVRIHGHGTEGFMVTGRDFDHARSYVGLYTRDSSCALTAVAFHVVPGIVERVFLTSTGHRRGKTLIVASSRAGRDQDPLFQETWSAYEMGRTRPIWSRRLTSSLHLRPRDRTEVWGPENRGPAREQGYWPLVIHRPGLGRESFVWDGRALVPDTLVTSGGTLWQGDDE
ncbi:MAG: hypothetical protein IT379_42455 [Deltaproteobacteria bacterium]|nr:hypothetical protein [Deltaproteobacteria bacterium]